MAVANSAAVAYADTDSESASTASSSGDETASAGPRASAENSGDEAEDTSSETGDDTADDDVASGDLEGDDAQESDADEDSSPAEQDEEEQPDPADPEVDADEAPPSSDPTADEDTVGAGDTPEAPMIAETSTATSDPEQPAGVAEESVEGGDLDEVAPESGGAPAVEPELQTDVVSLQTVSPDSAVVVATAAAPVQESVDIVSALVSSVVSPLADPAAPARAPWGDALLAWVRRQIIHTFFNKTPVAGPITTEQILTGQLVIDLNAYDPNGDPLTYTIVQPEHGLVFRDPITGNFVYTPTTIVTDPLTDSFTVVVSDSSEHRTGVFGIIQSVLHGLFRSLGIAQRDELTVTVPVTVNPIVQLPPLIVTTGLPIFTLGGSPVQLVSSATITDVDSDQLTKATVTIATGGKAGDVLSYVAPSGNPITASWEAATQTLTLTGTATIEQYEAAIKAVTFSTTEGGLPRGVTIFVTDDDDVRSLVPGAALVTVIGLPPVITTVGAPIFSLGGSPVQVVSVVEVLDAIGLPPVITTVGAPIFSLGGSPVQVVSVVEVLDADSDELSGATVTIVTGGQDGDVLDYTAPLGNPVTGTWDAATKTLTLTGTATIAQYEAAIKAITFSTTEGGLPRGLTVSVTDEAEVSSVVPGVA
ncbi:Ig-like domain-containing protein, partial [Mycolicibacterium pyrenivorans]|uniref:Ig-like domain-containing protein n=1 Tax=Mycolicibacterium pyrenivorans TaxID=187102 RepID=UPI0035589CB8|nr:hypothetical protein [Mycolicibacterium pyrenivorans]